VCDGLFTNQTVTQNIIQKEMERIVSGNGFEPFGDKKEDTMALTKNKF
jgi:hypothetical protein